MEYNTNGTCYQNSIFEGLLDSVFRTEAYPKMKAPVIKKDILQDFTNSVAVLYFNVDTGIRHEVLDILHEGTVYSFNQPLYIEIKEEDDLITIRNDRFDIFVFGDNTEEAINEFHFAFDALYNIYALEDDSKLTLEAIELKNDLKSVIAD